MLLGSKVHTQGNTTRWVVDYSRWLDNTATLAQAHVASSSASCTVATQPPPTVQGKQVVFFLAGGNLNETLTVSVQVTDTFGNVKNDTISYVVVAP